MKKIHKLIFTELFVNFFLTYLAFFTIILSIEFLDKIDDLVTQKVGFQLTIKYFLLRIPFIHSQMSLFATIISIMITLNILSQKNEITALLSTGITIKRIFSVLLIFVLFVSIITFFNDNFIYPKCIYKSDVIIKKDQTRKTDQVYELIFKTRDGFIFVNLFIPEKNILLNSYIIKTDKTSKGIENIFFSHLISKDGEDWKTEEATFYDYKARTSRTLKSVTISDIGFIENFSNISFKPDWLSFPDLLNIIKSAGKTGVDIKSFHFQMINRITTFISFFLLFYLIFPFGFQLGRNKKNVEIIFYGILILLLFTVARTVIFKMLKTVGGNPYISLMLIVLPPILAGYINWRKQLR